MPIINVDKKMILHNTVDWLKRNITPDPVKFLLLATTASLVCVYIQFLQSLSELSWDGFVKINQDFAIYPELLLYVLTLLFNFSLYELERKALVSFLFFTIIIIQWFIIVVCVIDLIWKRVKDSRAKKQN